MHTQARLYSLWHRYVICYHTEINHCVQTGIYLLCTPKEWLLRQLLKILYIHCISITCTYCVIVCIYMCIHCTWVPRIVCIYHYGICHCILACTAFETGLDIAIIQESAILYMLVSCRDILPENGCGRFLPPTCHLLGRLWQLPQPAKQVAGGG